DDISLKEKIVLGVGRLTYQKNFMRLINIWKNIDTNGWRLCIVGDGEERKEILTFCRQNGIDNVEVYEATNNIDSWYKKSSALAMTSRYEGLPMVLIEAKNFGVPAIAFDCQTGPVEIIDNDGYVIDYDDDKEYGNKL
ncbi:glycosyltransferase, partial [Klebsiella pneumoniae]